MITALIWSFLVGFSTSQTIIYQDCKAQDFKTDACSSSKILDSLSSEK